jgi:hypothetical protein
MGIAKKALSLRLRMPSRAHDPKIAEAPLAPILSLYSAKNALTTFCSVISLPGRQALLHLIEFRIIIWHFPPVLTLKNNED